MPTKVFKSGNSVAVRLPQDIAMPAGTEVEVTRQGDVFTIVPVRRPMAELVEILRQMPKPSRPMKRERIIFPKRPGL